MEINGIEMPYGKIGNGDKTLVIIPGLSVRQVSPMIDAVGAQYQAFLDDGYTIYVFDRRTNAPEGYTVEQMAEDTAACLKELGVENADVMGASEGGMMSLYIAANHPELVNHLMLCSTCARVNDTLNAALDQWVAHAKAKQEKELVESFGTIVYSPAVWEANGEAIIAGNSDITDEEYARFIQMASAMYGYDCRDRLGDIQAKALVISAEGDRAVTAQGGKELSELLDCEFYLYDDSFGHAVYDEAPDCVSRLLEFCKK